MTSDFDTTDLLFRAEERRSYFYSNPRGIWPRGIWGSWSEKGKVDMSDTLLEASREWYAARRAAMKNVCPETFDRLAKAESALCAVVVRYEELINERSVS